MMQFLITTILLFAQVSNEQTRLEKFVSESIPSYVSTKNRESISRVTVSSALLESERRGLDIHMMLAMGYIESRFLPWAKRQDGRYLSLGTYQVLKYGVGPTLARKEICKDGIKRLRSCNATFSETELFDPRINAYAFALELSEHVKRAKKAWRQKSFPCEGVTRDMQKKIWWYSHYNSGNNAPTRHYQNQLCKALRKILEAADV